MKPKTLTFLTGIACAFQFVCGAETYRMCVPHHIFSSCQHVASLANTDVKFECVPARDRMECLEKVQNREADFVAADPEDMYVAFGMKNEDFSIFSELRTTEESEAEFRYEGIILTRRNSNIKSMEDLRGKKSCHTGFGRNVGYKIPITRLKKHGVLKISPDPTVSPVEKELRALSEFFAQSCIVGTYSPDPEIDHDLKSKYANLCSLCEHPNKCNYPDAYSGYGGSIKCLVENGGDIAFTKVIYVRQYFGLPIGKNPAKTEPQGNPDDYEYLCEDGTRRPVTGQACTWAKRPWQGFMSNGDVNANVAPLQAGLRSWYKNGLDNAEKAKAADLWIDDKHTLVDKDVLVYPGDHLVSAMYKDVIERDGSTSHNIRICVKTDVEMRKCQVLKQAAYSRDIRPEFNCVESRDCLQAVHQNQADVVVIPANEFNSAKEIGLKKIMKETQNPDSIYAVVAEKHINSEILKKIPFEFDASDPRAYDVARAFNQARNILTDDIQSSPNAQLEIVPSIRLSEDKYKDKELVCPDFSVKELTQSKACNFDGKFTRGVFIRSDLSGTELDSVVHGMKSLSDKFGHGARLENVFEMFGEFETGAKNVIFSDNGMALENDDDINLVEGNRKVK